MIINRVKSFLYKEPSMDDKENKPATLSIENAACAILLEMASIDGSFSNEERETIIKNMEEYFDLTKNSAEELLKASTEELSNSIDLWQFTSCINENLDYSRRLEIIELIWKVIYSDNSLDKYEDYLIHKLQKLLRISHKDLISAKLKVLRA